MSLRVAWPHVGAWPVLTLQFYPKSGFGGDLITNGADSTAAVAGPTKMNYIGKVVPVVVDLVKALTKLFKDLTTADEQARGRKRSVKASVMDFAKTMARKSRDLAVRRARPPPIPEPPR